mmetsp:Transcript_8942/g.18631  ORF Transcript_8942/g.18631 Transcript_8942/m.18631 type:complete len:152 (+) Transcript_8942:1784-2239(+)
MDWREERSGWWGNVGAVTNAAFLEADAGVRMEDVVQRNSAAVAEANMIRRPKLPLLPSEECGILDALDVFAWKGIGRSWSLLREEKQQEGKIGSEIRGCPSLSAPQRSSLRWTGVLDNRLRLHICWGLHRKPLRSSWVIMFIFIGVYACKD